MAPAVPEAGGDRGGRHHVVAGDPQRRQRVAASQQRGGKQRQLGEEGDDVDRSLTEQSDVGGEDDEVQRRAEVTQQPVRDELEGEEGRVAARGDHAFADDDVPEPDHHPPFAGELALHGRDHLLLRPRRRRVEGAQAALGQLEGEGEVMAPGRGQRQVGAAADRVDGAVAGGDPAQGRLHPPHRHLVAPVGALEVVAAGVDEADLAADVADARVGEGLDQAAQGVGRPGAVGVGEGEQVAGRDLGSGVEGGDLAPGRQLEHEVGAGGAGALGGGIGGAVGGDDDPQPLARVVEGERVGDLGGDHLLLVVGGDDQGDGGRRVGDGGG